MAQAQHIVHSIPPTFDERSRVLVLGTMPSPASRELGFNYGHPRNRFWSVMAQLAGEPLPATNERKRDFCLRHHIALWDVLAECQIEGASDASIRDAVPNKLTDITRAAPIEAVFCTGAKSYELYNRLCADEVGIPAVKLPSTSPANAACGMERLLDSYAAVFEHVHPFQAPTLDVPRVVALERAAADAGTPLFELMDRAGGFVAWRVRQMLDGLRVGDPSTVPLVTILCGSGNNGGDGWVAAKLLAREGVAVCLLTAKLPAELRAQPAHDAAVEAFDELAERGARVLQPGDELPLDANGALASAPLVVIDDGTGDERPAVEAAIARAHVVVDAMMGTGSSGAPRQPFLNWVNTANATAADHATLAVDVPSGVDANTGQQAEVHLVADETLAMIVNKPGLTAPACGHVSVAPLAYIEPLL